MGMLGWADKRLKALTIWDIGVLKFLMAVFGMIVGAYLAAFVKEQIWWFVAVGVLLWAFLIYRLFTARHR